MTDLMSGSVANATFGVSAIARHSSLQSILLVPRSNALLCDTLAQIFHSADQTLCQTLTGNVHQIRWMIATAPRSVCLLDNPSEALADALLDVPNRPPIVLLVPAGARATQLRSLMKLNPLAVVSYEASLQELQQAIESANRGARFIGESMRGMVYLDAARNRLATSVPSPLDELTARQLEVAKWLVDGYTIAEVAEIMNLAEKTVESHRYRIMGRLNLTSRVELTRLLVQEGVVPRNYRNRSERESALPHANGSAKRNAEVPVAATALQ